MIKFFPLFYIFAILLILTTSVQNVKLQKVGKEYARSCRQMKSQHANACMNATVTKIRLRKIKNVMGELGY
ncbi:hypothetical protein Godav_010876, partial [Gossypium davidsonii]|nr:hypothetical protein [Gossypium davidsonii]